MTDFSTHETAELRKLAAEKREILRASRFAAEGSRSRNTREGRTTRKEIAQILTELRKRELLATT